MLGPWATAAVAVAYILIGLTGFVLNIATIIMILTRRVYRLSAYSIMANVALADAMMMLAAGTFCGVAILLASLEQIKASGQHLPFLPTINFNAGQEGVGLGWGVESAYTNSSGQWAGEGALLTSGMDTEQSEILSRAKRKGFWYGADADRGLPTHEHRRSPAIRRRKFRSRHQHHSLRRHRRQSPTTPHPTSSPAHPLPTNAFDPAPRWLASLLSFVEICAWTAGVMSYAFLGLNRCVAICFYSTRAKTFNRVVVAIAASVSTWLVGMTLACMGTVPSPLVGIRLDMWSSSFVETEDERSWRALSFITLSMAIHFISAALQWLCSTLVLLKIHKVKKKILKNKLNQNSANRFRRQARLTFQFFYPSTFCTITSILYFAKPLASEHLSDGYMIALHMIWLGNHICNPFIYAYFNERMRSSYREILTFAWLRRWVARKRKQRLGLINFGNQSRYANQISRRSQRQRSQHARISVKSTRSTNGNFVRSSLQMQSRDFEQLCEFMMRVNPLNVSSEGWRESSGDECLAEAEEERKPTETRSDYLIARPRVDPHRASSRSTVVNLGLQTVEHWARFAKKASI